MHMVWKVLKKKENDGIFLCEYCNGFSKWRNNINISQSNVAITRKMKRRKWNVTFFLYKKKSIVFNNIMLAIVFYIDLNLNLTIVVLMPAKKKVKNIY